MSALIGSIAATGGSTVDASPFAAVVAVALVVAAGIGVLRVWLSTRPERVEPGARTMDLGDETPAVVDLLTGGFEVDVVAVPATTVDLAARGWFDIEEYGDDVLLRLRSRRPDTGSLTPYEARILRHVERHAVDGVAPAATLTIGPDGVSDRWFTGFVREVTAHGRSLGLCRRRFDLRHLATVWGLVVVGAGPAWLVAGFAPRTDDPTGWGSIGNLVLGIAVLGGFGLVALAGRLSRTDAQADTSEGRAVASRWLGVREFLRDSGRFEDKPAASVAVWGRHLAYATAMGLAPEVQRQLPFETEHDRHAWSRATGRWRRVKVRYQSFRPGWGQHPGRVACAGLLRAVILGFVAYAALYVARADSELDALDEGQRRWVGLVALVVAALASIGVASGVAKLIVGLADLVPRRTIEGVVVRRRRFRTGHRLPRIVRWGLWSGRDDAGMRRDANRSTKHHVAIDDGSDERVLAFVVGPELFGRAAQGALVRAKVSPLLGYVAQLELVAPPPPSAASEPAVAHPLAEEAVERGTSAVAERIGGALAGAASTRDVSGRPLLDQRDDDGVTMRERLAESQEQLDRLRNDPRFAGTPITGFLDQLGGSLDRVLGEAGPERGENEPGASPPEG